MALISLTPSNIDFHFVFFSFFLFLQQIVAEDQCVLKLRVCFWLVGEELVLVHLSLFGPKKQRINTSTTGRTWVTIGNKKYQLATTSAIYIIGCNNSGSLGIPYGTNSTIIFL